MNCFRMASKISKDPFWNGVASESKYFDKNSSSTYRSRIFKHYMSLWKGPILNSPVFQNVLGANLSKWTGQMNCIRMALKVSKDPFWNEVASASKYFDKNFSFSYWSWCVKHYMSLWKGTILNTPVFQNVLGANL